MRFVFYGKRFWRKHFLTCPGRSFKKHPTSNMFFFALFLVSHKLCVWFGFFCHCVVAVLFVPPHCFVVEIFLLFYPIFCFWFLVHKFVFLSLLGRVNC